MAGFQVRRPAAAEAVDWSVGVVARAETRSWEASARGGYTNTNVKGAILKVNDTLYVTSADHVWALDARDGRELWHFAWRTRGATHTGNRGAAIWHNYLFFETPDNYLVSLDARTGQERWHVEIASFEQQVPSPLRRRSWSAIT